MWSSRSAQTTSSECPRCASASWSVGLSGAGYQQQIVRPLCAQSFQLPPGTSTYDVVAVATLSSCTTEPPTRLDTPACLADGSMPPLPPGDYGTFVEGPAVGEGGAPMVAVTVTDG